MFLRISRILAFKLNAYGLPESLLCFIIALNFIKLGIIIWDSIGIKPILLMS